MSNATHWWWIRHAPVTCNDGRIYGQTDHPADCSETAPFKGLAQLLPQDALWITSNLRRTRDTMEAVAPYRSSPLPVAEVVASFAEQHFGDWQGLRHDELRTRPEREAHRFWLAPAATCPPGGESFVDLMNRVSTAITDLSRQHSGRHIVVFAHGGTIRAALALALGLDPERALGFTIENCSLTRIEHWAEGETGPESWRVVTTNHDPRGYANGVKQF
ncbi:histidine phosphatase family protein [Limibacillus halophilus]|uniref:Broad specificity phosphatase PhoE n=1 Tax=Limibacillus halophilus TaxID=1579333 RepID=A0A839T015_9PROT|nr:histidine phosphatase family protein [Limibacillus halophilus]MBB3066493.1 broad specificity phosphatase PhoE [Limibacillus halophilus]